MIRKLVSILSYSSGYHTRMLSQKLNSFIPTSQQQIMKTLSQISVRKEYIQSSPVTQSFVNQIQKFVLMKSGITTNALHIYQSMKQMGFMNLKFKYGMYRKLCKEMDKIAEKQLNLKNNQLEVLLWFLYREYPFMRESKFQDIAADSSLKLFDMHQYMNSQKKLPMWQPYIRITTMLQSLGHNPPTRFDISLSQLKQTSYLYYPYLPNIFPQVTQYKKFGQKNNISQPFLMHLCNEYVSKDKIRYDTYMHHIQKIDNQQTNQSVQHIVDVLTWDQFVELLELYAKAVRSIDGQLDEELGYNVSQIFWRLCQSTNVNIEAAIRILQIISQNPMIYIDNISKLLPRTKDALLSYQTQQYRFLPSQAYIVGIKSCIKLRELKIDPIIQDEIINHIVSYIGDARVWGDGDKDILKDILEKEKIDVNKQGKQMLGMR